MIIDIRTLKNKQTIEADICIIGAGAAGISMAIDLDASGIKVCILESGELSKRKKHQNLYKGENVGLPYELDTTRARFLGGSTNWWGGWCRPMNHHDFSKRNWVKHSGWPIDRDSLEPYYEKAHEILGIKSNIYDSDESRKIIGDLDLEILDLDSDRVSTQITQVAHHLRLSQDYRELLENSINIQVYLHANVTAIKTNQIASEVTGIDVTCLRGKQFLVKAKQYVLATGGIENARILLLSNENQPAGLGNQNDLVGRYFTDHPRITTGEIQFTKPFDIRLYDCAYGMLHSQVAGTLVIGQEIQKKEKLLKYKAYIDSIFEGEETESAKVVLDIYRNLRNKELPDDLARSLVTIIKNFPQVYKFILGKRFGAQRYFRCFKLSNLIEPEPNPNSRVTLSEQRDCLGLNKVKLDWQLTPLVLYTLLRSQQIIREELEKSGLGKLIIDPRLENGEWPGDISWVWHHMGTTRMDPDPKNGVVDADCKVHGISNLYVSGSSVFPTYSKDLPTINIIALATRLSQHLRNKFER